MKKQTQNAPPAKTISVRLRVAQLSALDAFARQAGTTRTALIQLAIARFLKEGI
jgi:predicted transcriptional regulator